MTVAGLPCNRAKADFFDKQPDNDWAAPDYTPEERARTLGTATVCRPCARLMMHMSQGTWHEA